MTAVELLPVFEFDEDEISGTNPLTGQRLINYWGYSPISFFNPHEGYCVAPDEGSHVREFRDMVKALHRAGIEVILDVVFNHTGEGNHEGPTISFRGLDNSMYYHLEPYDKQYYTNLSGCGNTFNCNVPLVEKFIAECLLYWVREMHVDGFRFDLASILSRGPDGNPMDDPPVLWHIELDNELSDTKIIAEAWDAGGLYQVGYFPGYRWAEWNGRFRDDIRALRQGRQGHRQQGGGPDRRQRRHLPGRRRAADQQHQLHHRPRRLHAERPGLVQRQAQRGQRREQQRRHQRQHQLEPRRRGRDRRPGDPSPCGPARCATS